MHNSGDLVGNLDYRNNIDFKINNNLMQEEFKVEPSAIINFYHRVEPDLPLEVFEDQDMMPSDSARLRLINFRAELQNIKLNN